MSAESAYRLTKTKDRWTDSELHTRRNTLLNNNNDNNNHDNNNEKVKEKEIKRENLLQCYIPMPLFSFLHIFSSHYYYTLMTFSPFEWHNLETQKTLTSLNV
jgi:hypothetical protein